jgi:hypothetical protein
MTFWKRYNYENRKDLWLPRLSEEGMIKRTTDPKNKHIHKTNMIAYKLTCRTCL